MTIGQFIDWISKFSTGVKVPPKPKKPIGYVDPEVRRRMIQSAHARGVDCPEFYPCPPKKAGTTSKAFALTMLALIAGIVALCISTSVI